MPVRLEDAEEYELPALRRGSGSNRNSHDGDFGGHVLDSDGEDDERQLRAAGEADNEQARLLAAEGKVSGELDEDDDEYVRRVRSPEDEDEMIGKGGKVEALIARVSWDGWKCQLTNQSVPSTDDPSLPSLTFRVIVLGSFFCVIGAAASMMFYFKSNAPSFSSYFIILATYPLGHLMANEKFIRRGRRVLGVNLNPGPFSVKEAILVR